MVGNNRDRIQLIPPVSGLQWWIWEDWDPTLRLLRYKTEYQGTMEAEEDTEYTYASHVPKGSTCACLYWKEGPHLIPGFQQCIGEGLCAQASQMQLKTMEQQRKWRQKKPHGAPVLAWSEKLGVGTHWRPLSRWGKSRGRRSLRQHLFLQGPLREHLCMVAPPRDNLCPLGRNNV